MFFKIKTVSSILSSFANTLRELEEHAEARLLAAAERRDAAAAALKEAEDHQKEATQAQNVAAKLKDLLG